MERDVYKRQSLWVMLAIMIGGSAFGFIGMLVGVPTAAVIYLSLIHIFKIIINLSTGDVKRLLV